MRTARPDTGSAHLLHVSEADLGRYVAGGLSASRRTEIEGFLACNPDLAARVMQAMHQHERRGAMQAGAASHTGRTRIRTVTLGVACAIAGWAVAQSLDEDGPFHDLRITPEYVEDAVMSQRVTHVRIGMASQVETPLLNPEEIERATGIRMPAIAEDWQLLDAQIYPSEQGPSISVLMQTRQGRKLNLFAVRANTAAGHVPVLAREHGEYAAYWEHKGAAYVVTGEGSPAELLGHAAALASGAPISM